ncbi:MAG TPA: DNA methyltransferase [Holophagaceae bacterium]|nr:DNA methyltransferase [Holophagaceae bacterium]
MTTPPAPSRSGPTLNPRVQIIYRPLEDLTEDPRNPRVHSPRQIRQLARSIEAFGFNVPVLVDGAGQIIAGHGRLQACHLLGWTEVPTLALEHLTEAQAKAFQIADNRLTELSTWDDRLLAEQLKSLSAVDLGFSLEATGFEMGEIDLRIEGLEEKAAAPDPADALPSVPARPPVTRPGDLWCLGPHRLLCGNALEASDLDALMDGTRAALVFTDPPYNVPIDGHAVGNGRIHHADFAMACGEMDEAAFTAFLAEVFRGLARHSAANALQYVCMDWRHLPEVLAAGRQVAWSLRNLCVWVKDNAGMGSFYRSQHELVLVFQNGTGTHQNHVQLGRFGRNRSNVWRYPGVNSFGRTTEEGNLLALHPTVKPVALVADALLDASRRGETVLDPFLGSGTTLLAAERVGRVAFGLELDPGYVDTAIRRWQAWTGGEALRADGRSFADLEREAAGPEDGADGR